MTGVNAWETTSGPVIRPFDGGDPTPGLVLIYSRLHAGLPSAFPFAQNPTRIGRELDNEIAIPEGAVSRYHARVERVSSDGWLLRDLGSTNGTIVNGITITQPHLLRTHDVVRIGDTIMRFTPQNLYAFTAYRIDGTVVEGSRPVSHSITQPLLVGGLQVDQLLERIDKIGASELSVFISGESGTGKELIARELHRRSQRRGAFQAINCAALPGHLIESELFGYKRGSFTGAHADKVGLVKLADRGTLFLDEIGDMPFDAQAKLLRVLQEREVLPLGGTTVERVDVRVVCATNRDLDRLVAAGTFRGDLLARVREATIVSPPLRERREDIYPLALHFMRKYGRPDVSMHFPFVVGIAHYHWPYNVRELESAIKLAITLANGRELDTEHLPESIRRVLAEHGKKAAASNAESYAGADPSAISSRMSPPHPGFGPPGGLPSSPHAHPPPAAPRAPSTYVPTESELRELLTRHRGNIAAVGRELGKERMQIHRWLKRYAIDPMTFRDT